MTGTTANFDGPLKTFLRIAPWVGAAALLAAPAVAMRFTTEVNWTAFDFAAATILFLAVLVPWELAARKAKSLSGLLGVGAALGTSIVTVWAALAVGIVGSEDEPANLAFFVPIGVFLLLALFAAFRPGGMARAAVAAAAAELVAGAWAFFGGYGVGGAAWPVDVLGAAGVLTVAWLLAAALFARAATVERSV